MILHNSVILQQNERNMRRERKIPERQRDVWNASGACYYGGAGTRGFAQTWGHPRGYCGWSSSPDVTAPDCEANPWGRHSGCYLTSPDIPDCSVGCQERRGSHEISSLTSGCVLSALILQQGNSQSLFFSFFKLLLLTGTHLKQHMNAIISHYFLFDSHSRCCLVGVCERG